MVGAALASPTISSLNGALSLPSSESPLASSAPLPLLCASASYAPGEVAPCVRKLAPSVTAKLLPALLLPCDGSVDPSWGVVTPWAACAGVRLPVEEEQVSCHLR